MHLDFHESETAGTDAFAIYLEMLIDNNENESIDSYKRTYAENVY